MAGKKKEDRWAWMKQRVESELKGNPNVEAKSMVELCADAKIEERYLAVQRWLVGRVDKGVRRYTALPDEAGKALCAYLRLVEPKKWRWTPEDEPRIRSAECTSWSGDGGSWVAKTTDIRLLMAPDWDEVGEEMAKFREDMVKKRKPAR
jgi:hypothetical protein